MDKIAELEADNMKLRRLLAYRVAGMLLYTDDGELQDASAFPFIDFKRDPVDLIEATLKNRAIAAAELAKKRFDFEFGPPLTVVGE